MGQKFEIGKRYVFRTDIYNLTEEAIDFIRKHGREPIWPSQCDGKEVKVKDNDIGEIDVYDILPEWCEEVESEDVV